MELHQRGESMHNSLGKTTDNLGNNNIMLVDGNSYASIGVANKENSSAITLQSYMQDGAGSSQRDDGTQIWHQNGQFQKANNAFTSMSIDMYGGGHPAAAAAAAPQMVYAVDMTDYSTAYGTHPAACQPFYQYGFGSQQTAAYTNSHVYQNPQVGYAGSMAPAQMTPYNSGNHYSNNSSYVHPPPLQQQPKNTSYSGTNQVQQQRGGTVSNNYMQMAQHPQNRSSYYVNPYVQAASQPVNNSAGETNVGSMLPAGQGQVAKTGQQPQKAIAKTTKLSSVFDNGSDNYTASWVSSTSSIPPDLKISPDHISNSGSTPVEYTTNCWNTEQGQNAAAHNQLHQSASVDEFAAGASATSGFSPPNAHDNGIEQHMGRVNLNHYGQKYASTSGTRPSNYHSNQQQHQVQQQPIRYVHPQSHQAKYNSATTTNNNNSSGKTPRQASGNTSSMPGSNMYATEYPQPPVHVNHSTAQAITQTPSDAVSWADVLKRNGNCSSGETRFCANNNFAQNMENNGQIKEKSTELTENKQVERGKGSRGFRQKSKRQSGGNGRRAEEMNGMHRDNAYTYGQNSLNSAAIKANSLHDSGYTGSSIQQQQKQSNRFLNNPNRRSFGKPPLRYGNPANESAKTTILPAQPPNFVNGPFPAGGNFPVYATQQPSYVANSRYVFNIAAPPQNVFQPGMHATSHAESQVHKLDGNGVTAAFNPPAPYLRSPMPIATNFLPHTLAPSFVSGMPPFSQMPPQYGRNGLGMQDEKFRNTWLDQAKPVNQVFNERMLSVYVTYHNNAVVMTRNNAKENGNLPYYSSLLSTALQCMQNSNVHGFNKKPNFNGEKSYFKDKKRAAEADIEGKGESKSPLAEAGGHCELFEERVEGETNKNRENQSESVDTADAVTSEDAISSESIPVDSDTEKSTEKDEAPAAADYKPIEVESSTEKAAEKKE